MIRLFLPPEELVSNEVTITGENARYLSLVLRIKAGESIALLDGHGKRHTCIIKDVSKKKVTVSRIKEDNYSAESPLSITLAQGIPKGSKFEFIIQKSVELGVRKILPLITERTQIRCSEKSKRWRKIAVSASQQSGREGIPEIEEPVRFEEFINNLNTPALPYSFRRIILSEDEKEKNLKMTLQKIRGATNIILLVGPEGGFSEDEVKTALQKGFISVSLGPRILRTETAPITAISIIQYELGDMG